MIQSLFPGFLERYADQLTDRQKAICTALMERLPEPNPDVLKVPDGCPVLIGQIPLRLLDLIFDAAGNKLVGNPEHDGHPMADLS